MTTKAPDQKTIVPDQDVTASPLEPIAAGMTATEDLSLEWVEQRARQVEAYKKLIQVSVRLTNEHDWVDEGGKPYLQASGAEKVATFWGVSMVDLVPPDKAQQVITDERGSYTVFTPRATFIFPRFNRRLEMFGKRSTRDAFFTEYTETVKQPDGTSARVKRLKPQSEVDLPDVMMAALSNLLVNGITRTVGLRNLTYDDLKAAGLDPTKIAKVPYASKDATGLAETVWKKLLWLSGGQAAEASALCEKLSSFKGRDGRQVHGKQAPSQLSDKALPYMARDVDKRFDAEFQKATLEELEAIRELAERNPAVTASACQTGKIPSIYAAKTPALREAVKTILIAGTREPGDEAPF